MRASCMECVAKHVGSAISLMNEVWDGYPEHLIDAIGELDQASQESKLVHPDLASTLRSIRKELVPDVLLAISGQEGHEAAKERISGTIEKLRECTFGIMMSDFKKGLDMTPGENV